MFFFLLLEQRQHTKSYHSEEKVKLHDGIRVVVLILDDAVYV